MFVTLRKDIPGVGKQSERISVSDAYARNVLLPRGWAFVGEQSVYRVEEQAHIDHEVAAKKLSEPIAFAVTANDKGKLYKKIGHKDIAQKLSERLKVAQSHVLTSLDAPYDSIGNFSAEVTVYGKSYIVPITITKA